MRCVPLVGSLQPQYSANSSRAIGFLKWFGKRHDSLGFVSLHHIDDIMASKREEGWSPRSLAAQCQALRSFFGYAEIRGGCVPGIPLGIRSPRIPKYEDRSKGPTWAEVRTLIESASGASPNELRPKPSSCYSDLRAAQQRGCRTSIERFRLAR